MAKNPAQGQRSTTDPKVLEAAAVGDAVTVDATTSLVVVIERSIATSESIFQEERKIHVHMSTMPNCRTSCFLCVQVTTLVP